MIILIMGVAGSGKTTIGQRLASDLHWPFYDADEFHPPANIAKMAHGTPLTDADRFPWLDAIRARMEALVRENTSAVITCSALKETYRQRLMDGCDAVRLVYLKGSYALIEERMALRQHFFQPGLLRSQFDTLEEPDDALIVEVDASPEAIVHYIREALGV